MAISSCVPPRSSCVPPWPLAANSCHSAAATTSIQSPIWNQNFSSAVLDDSKEENPWMKAMQSHQGQKSGTVPRESAQMTDLIWEENNIKAAILYLVESSLMYWVNKILTATWCWYYTSTRNLKTSNQWALMPGGKWWRWVTRLSFFCLPSSTSHFLGSCFRKKKWYTQLRGPPSILGAKVSILEDPCPTSCWMYNYAAMWEEEVAY